MNSIKKGSIGQDTPIEKGKGITFSRRSLLRGLGATLVPKPPLLGSILTEGASSIMNKGVISNIRLNMFKDYGRIKKFVLQHNPDFPEYDDSEDTEAPQKEIFYYVDEMKNLIHKMSLPHMQEIFMTTDKKLRESLGESKLYSYISAQKEVQLSLNIEKKGIGLKKISRDLLKK